MAATGEAVVSPVARKRIVRLTTDQVLRSVGALVDGAEQLAADLTMNDTFATCLARRFLAYALSEPPEDGVDACAVQDIMQAFASSSRQLPDLIRAVAVSKAFTERLGAQ